MAMCSLPVAERNGSGTCSDGVQPSAEQLRL